MQLCSKKKTRVQEENCLCLGQSGSKWNSARQDSFRLETEELVGMVSVQYLAEELDAAVLHHPRTNQSKCVAT